MRKLFQNEFCGYEKELFDILKSNKFGKFNITYRKEIGDQSQFMQSKVQLFSL